MSRPVTFRPVCRCRRGSGPGERGRGLPAGVRDGDPLGTCRRARVLPWNRDVPAARVCRRSLVPELAEGGHGVTPVDSTPDDSREPGGTHGVRGKDHEPGAFRGGGQCTVSCLRLCAGFAPVLTQKKRGPASGRSLPVGPGLGTEPDAAGTAVIHSRNRRFVYPGRSATSCRSLPDSRRGAGPVDR